MDHVTTPQSVKGSKLASKYINTLRCALNNTTAATDCQTPSGQIPGDEPEQGIDDYGGKDFETRAHQEMRYPNVT